MNGEQPDWYDVVEASLTAHIPPWDLAGLPHTAGLACWVEWIADAAYADAEVVRWANRKR